MPNVRQGSKVTRSGQRTRSDIMKTSQPGIPRDDLDRSFAGDENKGPAGNLKTDHQQSTHVKNRKIVNKNGTADDKSFDSERPTDDSIDSDDQ